MILLTGSLLASTTPDIKKALFVKIEKNVSKSFIGNMKKKAKKKNIPMVINPKFTCTEAGFNQKDLFAQGTMYVVPTGLMVLLRSVEKETSRRITISATYKAKKSA